VRNKARYLTVLIGLTVGFMLFTYGSASAGGYYHIVKKGDTLWDICEKYYGNPWLWPKLWEMNPFVTNPHLLKPGDKINLLEDVPLKHPAAREERTKGKVASTTAAKSTKWWERGIDVSSLTQVRSIGYFSREAVEPVGSIVSSDTERLILAEQDSIVVRIDEIDVQPGDIVWVYKSSELVHDPITNTPAGFVISILGNVKIVKQIGDGLYDAVVNESFKDIRVGDPLITYTPISPCVLPTTAPRSAEAEVLATKDLVQIIGQFTVVYLDRGKEQGIDRGNLFEVIKERPGLPPLIIGYALVLESRNESATAVIVEAKEHFFSGIKVKAIPWDSAPRYLSVIRSCT